jgi:peptidoglycan/LPS O-acetylase OafA/YrhL
MRLTALDGWRGLACIHVAIFHFTAAHSFYWAPWLRQASPLLELFFMISGFLMGLITQDKLNDLRSAAVFMIRRFGRIWPVHAVTLFVLIGAAAVRASVGEPGPLLGQYDWGSVIAQLAMLQTWTGFPLTWNFPAWTLSAEWVAYLTLAAVAVALPSRLGRLLAAGAIVLIAGACFYQELQNPQLNVISGARGMLAFFVGYLTFDLWRRRPIAKTATAAIAEPVVALATAGLIWAQFEGGAYFINLVVEAAFVYVFATGFGWVSRVVCAPPLLFLGRISFSLYLAHGVITLLLADAFSLLQRFFDGIVFREAASGKTHVRLLDVGAPWANDLLLVVYLALSLGAAMLLFRFVEEPGRKASNAFAKQVADGGFLSIAAYLPGRAKRAKAG